MSESPLVCYTRWSPNHSGKRNHVIDTITIHCVAANATIEALGATFASSSRGASSQYGIGTDGRIGQYVSEANRSWCSSNAANDHRAITIEVSNNGGAPDWPVSWAAYNSLIKLLVDICQRNGIKKLVWSTNKSDRVNHKNGCNMTVHRDFAAKSCISIESELLTPKGWVQLKDIKVNDEVMVVDLDTGSFQYEEVYDRVDDHMDTVCTIGDFTSTKDHRVVYIDADETPRIEELQKLIDRSEPFDIPMLYSIEAEDDLTAVSVYKHTCAASETPVYSEAMVSCVSVKSGTFVTRQNGKIFITGNCPGDYLYNRHAAIAAEVNRRLDEAEQAKEEEEEMDINKFIEEITPEQAYKLYQKVELHLKTVAEPDWSKKEGHWARAKAAGITDGSSPERAMKRDEAIAILGRLGQF